MGGGFHASVGGCPEDRPAAAGRLEAIKEHHGYGRTLPERRPPRGHAFTGRSSEGFNNFDLTAKLRRPSHVYPQHRISFEFRLRRDAPVQNLTRAEADRLSAEANRLCFDEAAFVFFFFDRR